MQVGGGAPLLVDIVVDVTDLLRPVAELRGDRLRGEAMVLRPEEEIELGVRQ